MRNLGKLLRTTALGGLLFLVPLVMGTVLLLKALEYMRALAQGIGKLLGLEPTHVLTLNLVALGMVFLLCLAAGLLAKTPTLRRFGDRVEGFLANSIPGYNFVKGFTDSLRESDAASTSFKPVVAKFDDNAQIAFEVNRGAKGTVIVYLPGAPNPWSGAIIHMTPERVEPLDMSMPEAIKLIRTLGQVATPPEVAAP